MAELDWRDVDRSVRESLALTVSFASKDLKLELLFKPLFADRLRSTLGRVKVKKKLLLF